MSIRGKSASGFTILLPGSSPPKVLRLSQEVLSVLSALNICSLVLTITGLLKTPIMRRLSARLYSTVPSRAFLDSSLASIQGIVWSIYLLQRDIYCQRTARADENCSSSILTAYSLAVCRHNFCSSSSISSGASGAGSTPLKYLSIMAAVRLKRLPRSFAKSLFMRLISASLVKLPSEPKVISLIRK